MRKKKTDTPLKKSKTPPAQWPTEEEWKEIDKELARSLPSNVLPKNASLIDKTKADICTHFIHYLKKEEITQRELAKKLEISESRVSEIVHYHFQRYTIDKLMELLNIIKPKMRVKVA